MGDMMDDINKFAKIWDNAVQKGIFNAPSLPANTEAEREEETDRGTDFFGQYLADDYDRDKPLNEVDTKYWAILSRKADPLSEENNPLKTVVNAIGTSQNPVYPNSVGKDQDLNVTPNWGSGGKEIEELEKLKVELHELESKLNSLVSKDQDSKVEGVQSKIDSLKNEIDKLSDSLAGNRFDPKSA
jgi:hypothetical protein